MALQEEVNVCNNSGSVWLGPFLKNIPCKEYVLQNKLWIAGLRKSLHHKLRLASHLRAMKPSPESRPGGVRTHKGERRVQCDRLGRWAAGQAEAQETCRSKDIRQETAHSEATGGGVPL